MRRVSVKHQVFLKTQKLGVIARLQERPGPALSSLAGLHIKPKRERQLKLTASRFAPGTNILITHDHRACIGDSGIYSVARDSMLPFTPSTAGTQGSTVRWLAPELSHTEAPETRLHARASPPTFTHLDVYATRSSLAALDSPKFAPSLNLLLQCPRSST
ncbi:hypothetical protein LshimejAT787_0701750 [Lyophyllum shimeji]|uniref:Uncharacterized protein n=1 Tax=Lyophyllum shimeji TaxID=47721 RepID=A0A9P3PPH9_LYOSH|nr:hypothetical protein LshimejAT787_0701750 [Lyophyllum shimeji]